MIPRYRVSLIYGHGDSFQDSVCQDSRIPGFEGSSEHLKNKTINP
jgi:hypothetical protein